MRGLKRESYEYRLTLQNVRMKVKFPCRMKIEHLGSLVTGQTPISGDNKYIFNQEIILRDDQGQQCFQFVINLVTQMGSKYIAGVIKLYRSQMVRSEGEKLVLSLAKCIDSQAFCQVKVDQVIWRTSEHSKSKQRRSSAKKTVNYNQRELYQIQSPKNTHYQQLKRIGSRTQYEYPSANTPVPPRSSHYSKSKANEKSQIFISPQKFQVPNNQRVYGSYEPSRPQYDIDMEDLGYKQAYLKLKQKYKKETQQLKNQIQKKNVHETNQNALKLQLMKYKIRFQELQRSMKQKNTKLVQNSTLNLRIRQLQSQNNYLNSQIKKRDNDILLLQDTIQSLTCDLQELTEKLRQQKNKEMLKVKHLQLNVEPLRQKLAQKQKQLQYFKLDQQELHKQNNQDLSFKNVQIQHDRKLILQLQKKLQAKIFQHEKMLQSQRAQNKQRIQEQTLKVQKLEKQMLLFSTQKQQLKRKYAEMQVLHAKKEYELKLLMRECESQKSQNLALKQFRQKFLQSSKENQLLTQRLFVLEGQISKVIESKKQSNFSINKQFQDQIEYFRKLSKDSDQKFKYSTVRINDLQSQLNLAKGQCQKMRRAVQITNQELIQLKEREKFTKKSLKERENSTIFIQTDYAALKNKINNIDEIYKAQIFKIKSQVSSANGLLEIQKTKNAQALQRISLLEGELKKCQQKLSQSQKRKEASHKQIAQNLLLVEELRKQNEIQSNELQMLNDNLTKKQRQQNFRLHEIQEDLKIKNDKIEKLKKDLKQIQEKYITQVYNLKNQTDEIQNLTDLRAQYEQILANLTSKVQQLYNQLQSKKSEQARLTKLNDCWKQQIEKIKKQLLQKDLQCQNNLNQNQDIRKSLLQAKDENSQLFQKLNLFKRDFQRFKENLTAIDIKYLTPIYSKQEKESNMTVNQQTTLNQLMLALTNQFKQIKHFYFKKQQQVSFQKKESQSLREQLLKLGSNAEANEHRLQNQIGQIQRQLERAYQDKHIQSQNFTAIINQMSKKMQQKESFEENMHNQIQQLNFNSNSMKLGFQATNDQNNKKIAQLKRTAFELQQKNKERQMMVQHLQEKISIYLQQISQKSSLLEELSQLTTRQEFQIVQLKQMLLMERKQLESLQKAKKQLIETTNELQFALDSIKDDNQKHKKSLEQEQANTLKLNILIRSLMKQKELGIKKQLQGNEIVTNIENRLLQKEKDIQLMQQQHQKTLLSLEGYKQKMKNLDSSISLLQTQLKKQKAEVIKLQQKLSSKDYSSHNQEEVNKKSFQAYEKTIAKLKSQKIVLQQNLQSTKSNFNAQVRLSSSKILDLENKIHVQNLQNSALENKNLEIEQKMFDQYQKITQMDEKLVENQKIIAGLQQKICQLDLCLNQVNQQLRLKDQKLFGLSDKNYNLEIKLQAQHQNLYEQRQRLNMEYVIRQQAVCQQYEGRIEILQTQIKGLKAQTDEKTQNLHKKNLEIKRLQDYQAGLKKQNQSKLKKIDLEKASALSLKNAQIKKLKDEIGLLSETIKDKQSQNRKNTAEIQTLRKAITTLQIKLNQYEQKNANLTKQQRKENQVFRKRQSQFRVFKETVISQKWNMQRQMKRLLQGYVRNFMDISDEKNTNKVIETLRQLQFSIFQVLNRNSELR